MTTPQLPAGLQGPQPGRTFLVTGATSGIGQAAAVALALAGARVVLAGRSETRLAATRKLIERLEPAARLESLLVDMASLASVRAAACSASASRPWPPIPASPAPASCRSGRCCRRGRCGRA